MAPRISSGRFCLLFVLAIASFVPPAQSIKCYQCVSTNNTHPFQCNEFMSSDIDMEPTPCDDVFGAQYCIKHVGRFEASGLECYQCTTDEEWKCMDGALVVDSLEPKSCDQVFEAQYCVKTVGRYGGGVGTKRFCSSAHLGNYCQYVDESYDPLEYRTCVYTCTGDGCNPASALKSNTVLALLLTTLGLSTLSFAR